MAEKFMAKSKAQAQTQPQAPPQPIAGTFWKFAIIFSFVLNVILVLVLLGLGALIFEIKNQIAQPLIGGLHSNFVAMDQASIVTTIPVQDTITVNDKIPVVFDLPLNQQTSVVLLQDTAIPRTVVTLNGVPLRTDIVLPAGTSLPVQLNMTVPVSQTIPVVLKVPVNLNVAVRIPLNQTELHKPFTSLAGLVEPYNAALNELPSSWTEIFMPK
jgi:hypothetical protein